MSEFEELMREYLNIEYKLDEAKSSFTAYNDKAAKTKRAVTELQAKAASIQHQVGKYMFENGVVEEKYGNVTIAPKKLPDLINVIDMESIPSKYINEKTTVKKALDKTKAKAAIKDGEAIKGVSLIQDRFAIRFKNVKISV